MSDLLSQLENKIAHAIEVIELLKLQLDELDEENSKLKNTISSLTTEKEKWKNDITALINQFDKVEANKTSHKMEEIA